MPINPSPNAAPSGDIDKHQLLSDAQPSPSCSSGSRTNVSPFGCLSSGVSNFSSANPSAMSAAAAAAFLLQAVTAGSANGDSEQCSSMPTRRSSAASFFESPRASPSFPSAVISAAAQQAAFAAAQAIGTSNTSPSVKASSDLQAAVISLALAANPPSSNQCDTHRYDTQEHAIRSSQAMTDFFLLSERHPELLTAHPALKSVFRRRSSTILPSYLSDLPTNDNVSDYIDSRSLGHDSNMSQNILSALELMNTGRPLLSDLSTSSGFPSSVNAQEVYSSDQGTQKEHFVSEVDHYHFPSSTSVPERQSPKCNRQYPSNELSVVGSRSMGTVSSALACDRHLPRTYKGSPHFETHPSSFSMHSSTRNNLSNRCVSPTVTSSLNDGSSAICHSTSPLSCSSLSNSATPRLNISPAPTDGRTLGISLETRSDSSTNLGRHRSSQRGECLSFQEIKSEFPMGGPYQDDPNRKREQRLIKNREAARECRRKKKEYVKCLEARVSLLESQNQRLAEELRHVKALCFKELCGLGLNTSTAACAAAAAAALAAATVPGIYSTSPTTSAAMASSKSTYAELSMRLADHPFEGSAATMEESQSSSRFVSGSRGRSRRRSVVASSKLSEMATIVSPNAALPSHYRREFVGKPEYSEPPPHPFPLDTGRTKQNGPQTLSDMPIGSLSDTAHSRVSSPYHSMSVTGDVYPPPGHVASAEVGRTNPRVGGLSSFHSTHPTASIDQTNQSPNFFLHPHATKRSYRNLSVNQHGEQLYAATDGGDHAADHLDPPKSSRATNTVAGAAAILAAAAAAAMVAESEPSNPESQLSV